MTLTSTYRDHGLCEIFEDVNVGAQCVRTVDGGGSLVSLNLILLKCSDVVCIDIGEASQYDLDILSVSNELLK